MAGGKAATCGVPGQRLFEGLLGAFRHPRHAIPVERRIPRHDGRRLAGNGSYRAGAGEPDGKKDDGAEGGAAVLIVSMGQYQRSLEL